MQWQGKETLWPFCLERLTCAASKMSAESLAFAGSSEPSTYGIRRQRYAAERDVWTWFCLVQCWLQGEDEADARSGRGRVKGVEKIEGQFVSPWKVPSPSLDFHLTVFDDCTVC